MLAEEEENEVQALFSATLAPPDADAATISLTWMALSPFGFVTCRNCARQTSGVSDGVADRDLVADAESEADTLGVAIVALDDVDGVAVATAVAVLDRVTLGDTLGVAVRDADTDGEAAPARDDDTDGVAVATAVTVLDRVTLGDTLGEAVRDAVCVGDAAALALDGDTDGVLDRVTLTDTDGTGRHTARTRLFDSSAT